MEYTLIIVITEDHPNSPEWNHYKLPTSLATNKNLLALKRHITEIPDLEGTCCENLKLQTVNDIEWDGGIDIRRENYSEMSHTLKKWSGCSTMIYSAASTQSNCSCLD